MYGICEPCSNIVSAFVIKVNSIPQNSRKIFNARNSTYSRFIWPTLLYRIFNHCVTPYSSGLLANRTSYRPYNMMAHLSLKVSNSGRFYHDLHNLCNNTWLLVSYQIDAYTSSANESYQHHPV